MAFSPFISDDNKLFIPKELLIDIQFQLQILAANEKSQDGDDAIASYLRAYYGNNFKEENEELYKWCKVAKIGLSESSYVRAIKGKKGSEHGNIKYELLDFLCFSSWKRSLLECVADTKYINSETLYSVRISSYGLDQIKNNIKKNITDNDRKVKSNESAVIANIGVEETIISETKEHHPHIELKWIQVLNKEFWNNFLITDENEKIKKLSRYFTHTDSSLAPYVIANGEILELSEMYTVGDIDDYKEEKTVGQILDLARSQAFSLIKIIADGGIGKTTFLLSAAWSYKESYAFISVEHIDSETFWELIDEVKNIAANSELPLVILIDNVADTSIAGLLVKFIIEVKRAILPHEVIFVFAERPSRYTAQFEDDEIEQLFSGDVQTIEQLPLDVEALFEKIYSWFAKKYPQLQGNDIEKKCRESFLATSILGISERTFRLINNLKLNYNINYKFDWDDWDKFIENNSQFYDLQNLFIIVSCFYQFGIKVNIAFKSSFLGKAGRLEIIRAINALGIEKSPIVLKENNQFLALKHEHIASWFCSDTRNANLVQGFFRDFMQEIDNEISSKLIRKIRKASRLSEFKESCIAADFTSLQYLKIIEGCLERSSIISDDRKKMLNEKGITLLSIGNEMGAMETFQKICEEYPDNNHARDQLAKLYLQSPSTYQLALQKYLEIYKNGGIYAKIEIYKLVQRCISESIPVTFPPENILDVEEANILAKKCIVKREFLFAEEILSKIEGPNKGTAECYNLLALLLPYTVQTNLQKHFYFKKAIEIQQALSENEQYQFEIDYAVFLYRIRDFDTSTRIINKILKKCTLEQSVIVSNEFNNKTRNITRLFFGDLPPKEDIYKRKMYLAKQSKDAAALVNLNQKNVNTIIKGILILNTVRIHSNDLLPEIYKGAGIQLGYAYSTHSVKCLFNLSEFENRIIANNYYDKALKSGGFFSMQNCMDMVRNLMSMNARSKYSKALGLLNLFLEDEYNRSYPGFYRLLGNALGALGRYDDAIDSYNTCKGLLDLYQFESTKDYANEKAYLYNNFALLICNCYEKSIRFKKYTLREAKMFCEISLRYKPNFPYALETLERINGYSQL